MRYALLFACLGTCCCALATAAAGGDYSSGVRSALATKQPAQTTLAELIESKVRAAWAAFKTKDEEKYAAFLTDDFQAVEADGEGERSKARTLREVGHSMYTDYQLQLFQVQTLGPAYVFVTYEATIQFPAGSAARYKRIFVGELWTERAGQWKMMRYQETPVR